MEAAEAKELAIEHLNSVGIEFFRFIDCGTYEPRFREFFGSQMDSLQSSPNELWGVRFDAQDPSSEVIESHGIVNVLIDGETGDIAIFR